MMAQETNCDLDRNIIRSLIVARGPNGATLSDIKQDYFNEVGNDIDNSKSDFSLRKWLESIDHISTECRKGTIVYFSKSPDQEHLVKMICKQKNTQRSIRKTRKRPHEEFDSSTFLTPRTFRDSTLSKSRKSSEPSFRLPQSLANSNFMQPKTFSRTFTCSSKPSRRSLPVTSSVIGSAQMKFPNFASSDDEDNNKFNSSNSFRASKLSFISDKIVEATYHNPLKPEFYKFVLVGDNFFLNLAVKNMNYRMISRENILQSGYCVSGQTIDRATETIKRMHPKQMILLNIGAVDIMNGRELIELVISMMRLLKTCRSNNITPVLATLPAIANHRIYSRALITTEFNKFLMKNPFDYPVIDLQEAFINSDGKMDPNCYDEIPRYVSGFKKPIVLWSKMGRQRAMTTLKEKIGSAILKILIK